MEAPSAPSGGLGMKFKLLWETKKPLVIAIIILLILLICGIIFVIVYFLIIKPNQDNSEGEKEAAEQAAHTLALGLRHYWN